MSRKHIIKAFALALATTALSTPASAEDIIWTCPRIADTETATLTFDPKIFGIDSREDDGGSAYEMQFYVLAEVREYDAGKPGWTGPKLCDFSKGWIRDLPIPNILYEFNSYPMPERFVIRNVPRHSIVKLIFLAEEQDDFARDFGDFSPDPLGFGDIELTVLTDALKAQSMTGRRAGQFDITFGQDKRLVGDGKIGINADTFRGMLEFNLGLAIDPPGVGGISPNLPSPGQLLNPPPPGIVNNEPACRDYALKAVEMNTEALKLGCGFAAPVWSNNHQMHFDWCMQGANVAAASGENIKRAAALDACRVTHASSQPAPGLDLCGVYANEAVKAAVTADVLGCGFVGPRWVQDFGAHFNFCAGNPLPPLVLAEQLARDAELQSCRAALGK
ncbi:hypothetical protein [Phaeovulum sp.]|uniref:hypothetical protein n=1 Tax=Phaeovulum sp. TaxID=2934796 RepID=UPI002731799A|nr:hypothetical protein [Phaeovulum sp.]MDP1669163.1 hypothetical protein [Phaeovulum sp.]MDZ4117802.1 hypothetical protein [Phaeovulum sp.]